MASKVVVTLRLPSSVLAEIDNARGLRSRQVWIEGAIDAALYQQANATGLLPGEQVIPAETVKAAGRRSQATGCPHPRARVIKGFCYACGWPVTTR